MADGEIKHIAIKDLLASTTVHDDDYFIISNMENTYKIDAQDMATYFVGAKEIISKTEPMNQKENDYWIYPY